VFKLVRLRQLREQRFMSQQDLAEKAGVSRATIVKAEQGRRVARFVTARKLAEALRVEPSALIGEDQ
jgi:DNA-binding XRE family transcriptional regulator